MQVTMTEDLQTMLETAQMMRTNADQAEQAARKSMTALTDAMLAACPIKVGDEVMARYRNHGENRFGDVTLRKARVTKVQIRRNYSNGEYVYQIFGNVPKQNGDYGTREVDLYEIES